MSDDRIPEPEFLRATSDQLVIAIEETATLERKKRGVRPADPAFPGLALDVRRAAEHVLRLARDEEVAARATFEAPSVATLPPIDNISPAKELATILDEWRRVEQRLLDAAPGSPEAAELRGRFDELRERYAQALKARQERD